MQQLVRNNCIEQNVASNMLIQYTSQHISASVSVINMSIQHSNQHSQCISKRQQTCQSNTPTNTSVHQ